MSSTKKIREAYKIPIHILFMLISLTYIIPLIMVISISLSSEAAVTSTLSGMGGYSLLPKDFTFDAYKLAFKNPDAMIKAYGVTAFQAFFGTLLTSLVHGMTAYPLSRSSFAYKKGVTWYLFLTTLFGGGAIPTYIIFTQWYHLSDSIWVYILPSLSGGAMTIFMIRTYFQGLSEALYESAWLDGANEFTIFLRIALPLSTPIFAATGFLSLVGRWNNWQTSLIYIRDPDLYTLQYMLQRILDEAQFLKGLATNPIAGVNAAEFKMPSETLRYAMCVIAAGPMLVIFPFFQKYFSKGLTIGSVKG